MPGDADGGRRSAADLVATLVALGALAWATLLTAYVCFAPIATEDAWWHLKMGRLFLEHGPWLRDEPLLHTSSLPPSRHEWLFGAVLALVERGLGLWACRALQLGLVLLVLGQVVRLGRRVGGSLEAGALLGVAFLALALPRLAQLRPDLPTMAAALATVAVALDERRSSRRRLLLVAVLWLLWANWHSLFLVGPALVAAAALGAWLDDVAARRLLESYERALDLPPGLLRRPYP